MITIQAGHAVVIDDEPANRDFLERLLQTAGFKVSGAGNGADGLKACRAVPELAIALVDQELPDAKGLEILSQLRSENPESLLVMATMHDDRNLIDEAFSAGVDVFLVKPHGFMELYRRLQEADANASQLRRVIIDQYGPRPYRGITPKETIPATRPDEEATRPAQRTVGIAPDDPTVPRAAPTIPSVIATPTTPTAPATPAAASTPPAPAPTPTATPATPAPATPVVAPAAQATTSPAQLPVPAPAAPAASAPARPAEQPPTQPIPTPTMTPSASTGSTAPAAAPATAPSQPASQPPASPTNNAAASVTSNTDKDKSAETASKPTDASAPVATDKAVKDTSNTDVTIPHHPKDVNLDPKVK